MFLKNDSYFVLFSFLWFNCAFLIAQDSVIPHITQAGGGFETEILIENLSTQPQTLAMNGFNAAGQNLGTFHWEVPAKTLITLKSDDLFGAQAELSHLSFLDHSELNVTTVYRALDRQSTPAHVRPLSEQAGAWQFFTGNWDVAYDGIAVVNMGDGPSDIFVTHTAFDGVVLARQRIGENIAAKGKVLYVVGAPGLQPFATVPNSYFEVDSAQPLAVTALRGSDDGAVAHLWANTAISRPGPEPPSLTIEPVPASLGSQYTSNFDRYTRVTAPNGGDIHIVAQNNITDEQIIRCHGVLTHFLTDYPGSAYGEDKSGVANKMAENGAILLLLNGSDNGQNPLELPGQPLYQNEIQVEGHSWYLDQDYDHRDATFEEILHLVHDFGIGVDGPNSFPGALPAYQAEIRAAQQNALANNLWGLGAPDWISELAQENSLSQEYLAAVIDAYYGLWGAWTESTTHSMWGIYTPKDRAEIAAEDPMGNQLLEQKFFHPYLTYNARIDPTFKGTFSLAFDPALPYTHHAQYLKDITLLGNENTNVRVNHWNNDIMGNNGINTVIFSGKASEYDITTSAGVTTVTDHMASRDGINRLRSVEKLQFTDQLIE